MSTTKETNWYDNMLETQKKMAETMTETAKKFTSTDAATEVMENSKEFFNNWLNIKSEKSNGHSKNGNASEKHSSEKHTQKRVNL